MNTMNATNNKLPMVPRAVLVDLCREVDRLLKMQATYFKSKDRSDLAACKRAEDRMAKRVKELLANPDTQPTMWADDVSQVVAGAQHNVLLDICEKMRKLEVDLAAGNARSYSAILNYLHGTRSRLIALVPASKGGAA